jgi:dUTP pyrophosphatase
MKVKIKRIDKKLPLPQYQTKGAVGFDFIARESITVESGKIAKIPGNVIVKTPPGYMLLVASRGGTPFKKGLMPAHGVGIGDQDFCGEEDEYQIPVFNFTDKTVTVERGERIGQGIFVKVAKADFVEVKKMNSRNRGSFGSTGK